MTVRVSRLSKHFGADAVLRDIELNIADGEFLALLGPSGAGKTTLLRLIAGLDIPDQGRILIDDMELRSLPPRERRIGFVFQNYALFRHMTVADNIAFGLTVQRRRSRPRRDQIAARVNELLELMQLPGLGHRFPAQLSGGQRQRVALARALAVNPRVLLLDEPFGALDAKVRIELREWLRYLQQTLKLTTILVTHDRQEAFQLADRVAILRAGSIEQVGTAADIRANPATAFVAEFVDAYPRQSKLAFTTNDPATVFVHPPPEEIAGPAPGCTGRVASVNATWPQEMTMPVPNGSDERPPCVRTAEPSSDGTLRAGELWLIAVPDSTVALSQCQERALKNANVIIYDRQLRHIVSRHLPLGHYAEAATDNALKRCRQFARDGWSVVRLLDPQCFESAVQEMRRIASEFERGSQSPLAVASVKQPDAARAATQVTAVASDEDLTSRVIAFGPFAAQQGAGFGVFTANGLAG